MESIYNLRRDVPGLGWPWTSPQ